MTPRSDTSTWCAFEIPPKQLFCVCLLGSGWRTTSARQSYMLARVRHMPLAQSDGCALESNRRWERAALRRRSSLRRPSVYVRALNGQIQSLKSFMEWMLHPYGFLAQVSPEISVALISMTIDLISSSSTIFLPTKMELLWSNGRKSRIWSWDRLKGASLPRVKRRTPSWL